MPRQPVDAESAALYMRPSDINRPSRAQERPVLAGGRPKMPDGLTDEQQALFRSIVKQLRRRRTVTPGDAQVITLYVRTHTHWMKTCDYVDEHGPMITESKFSQSGTAYTVEIPNPALKLAALLASQLESLLAAMGLTGIARDKVRPVKSVEKPPAIPGTVGWFARAKEKSEAAAMIPDADIPDEVSDGGNDAKLAIPDVSS